MILGRRSQVHLIFLLLSTAYSAQGCYLEFSQAGTGRAAHTSQQQIPSFASTVFTAASKPKENDPGSDIFVDELSLSSSPLCHNKSSPQGTVFHIWDHTINPARRLPQGICRQRLLLRGRCGESMELARSRKMTVRITKAKPEQAGSGGDGGKAKQASVRRSQ